MADYVGVNGYGVYTLESSGVSSVTFSADASRIYAANRDGTIDVFDTQSHTRVTTWNIGSSIAAISLSMDGSFLLATEDNLGSTQAIVHRISTTTGSVQNYTTAGYFHDVEIINAHTAILTGSQIFTMDLGTGAFSSLPGSVYYNSYSSVLTRDQNLTLIAEPGISNGPLFIFDSLQGKIVADGDSYQSPNSGFNWGHQAISQTIGQVAQFVYYSTVNIYDLSLNYVKSISIPGNVDGLSYSQDGNYLYVNLIDQGILAKYSTLNWSIVDQFNIDKSVWHNHIGSGDQIKISDDGSFITVFNTKNWDFSNNPGELQIIDLSSRNEIFSGTPGADSFSGLDGNDTYIINHMVDIITEHFAQGTDSVISIIDFSLPENVEYLTLLAGSPAISAVGNSLDNIIVGNAENNIINGQLGADTMKGGLGNDLYFVDNVSDLVVEDVGNGVDTVKSSLSWTIPEYSEIENLIGIGSGSINLNGNHFNNFITGNALANIIYGFFGNDILSGDAGNDYLDGGLGNDNMSGGTGDDIFVVDSALDTVAEGASAGSDTVRSYIDYTLGQNVESLILLDNQLGLNGVGNDLDNSLVGGTLNNILYGGAGNDTLDGGLGADTLRGETGNDTYIVDSTGDVVIENPGAGYDIVRASASWALAPGQEVEELIALGTAPITLAGNEFTNILIGNEGANTLNGLGGSDVLNGGMGNDVLDGGTGIDQMSGGDGEDIYYVDDLVDVIFESNTGGTDTVYSSVNNYALTQNVENLSLVELSAARSAFGNNSDNVLIGNNYNNALYGDAGNDSLDGAGGIDTMYGGIGNDTYIVDSGNDQIIEAAGEGIDRVNTATSWAATENQEIEFIIAAGTLAINLTANSLGNTLIGNSAANILQGGVGHDVLSGGAGADTLNGGLNMDSLTGGSSADTFQGTLAELDKDTIWDFGVGDRIHLTDGNIENFNFSLDGSTLNYTGGSLTLVSSLVGHLTASVDVNGGVNIQLAPASAQNDVNGDGKSDILWRHDNGTVTSWLASGNGFAGYGVSALVSLDWRIEAADDFNGDGRSDILWRNDNGTVSSWLSHGDEVTGGEFAVPTGADWHIQATGDFNGDGMSDILWRNDDGTVTDWLSNGAGFVSGPFTGKVSNDWHIERTGDFNGDGRADILWRNDNGTVTNWLSNGSGFASSTIAVPTAMDWRVEDTADFNGDGKSDILWRHASGTVTEWLSNGVGFINGAFTGNVSNNWHIESTGDFNGDGKSDILWRNDDGTVTDWLSNGAGFVSDAFSGQVSHDWHILG